MWDPLFISATVEASNLKFGIQVGLGEQLTKNNFQDRNWQSSGLGEYPKNWDPVFIFAVIEASKFKFAIQFRLGQQLTKKQLFRQKLTGRGSGLESIEKNQDSLISATVEASNFKFGTQLRFGEYVTITTLVPNLVEAGCATGAPQKLWVSRTLYHVPCTS